jgi:hypothetical protein
MEIEVGLKISLKHKFHYKNISKFSGQLDRLTTSLRQPLLIKETLTLFFQNLTFI